MRVREGDQVVGPDEEVELGGEQTTGRLLEDREVEDDEDVVVIRVELRALVARVDVLEIERVEIEVLLEPFAMRQARLFDVDPAEPARLDDRRFGCLYVSGQDRTAARRGAAQQRAWKRQVGHRLGGFMVVVPGAILVGRSRARPCRRSYRQPLVPAARARHALSAL